MIIQTTNLDEARKIILKAKKENPKEEIIVLAQDDEFNRKVLEMKNVNMLLSPEVHNRKDKLKERDPGLNEVLCNIAAKNKIKIGIKLDEITKKQAKEKAIILSRIIQNIMLCKKSGTEIKIFSNDKKAAFSFLLTLGASTEQAKKAVD